MLRLQRLLFQKLHHSNDQGSQFTSNAFTSLLLEAKVRISMDGKGRAR